MFRIRLWRFLRLLQSLDLALEDAQLTRERHAHQHHPPPRHRLW